MADRFISPLIDSERASGYFSTLVSSIRRPGLNFYYLPFDLNFLNILFFPIAVLRVIFFLNKYRPDIVFCHNTKSSLIPLLSAYLSRVRVRVYFNHGVPYVGYRGFLRFLLLSLERLNCSLACHVVTVSRDMQDLLKNISFKVDPIVIRHGSASGIDFDFFSNNLHGSIEWRKINGFDIRDLVVVFIGRPLRRKGFNFVLNLWARNFSESHFKLVLCGPTNGDVLKVLSSVPDNIISLGFVNNVNDVLAYSDLLILPSLHEGLSYACMEAQASGVVVVGNNVSGIRCLIENGSTGFLVNNNTENVYVDIIRYIDSNRSSLSPIIEQAKTSVFRYSRDLFIKDYLIFLDGIK